MMQARMTNPVMVLPDAMKALLALGKAAQSGTVPVTTHKLIALRVSQINGCSLCVDMHAKRAQGRRREGRADLGRRGVAGVAVLQRR
jgi:AhpD family alkylhydroperoxidase